MSRTFVIFNPAAGRGRCAKRIELYRSLLSSHGVEYDHVVTERAGQEIELADRAAAGGYDTVVAVGGDGTWSVVADRLVRSGNRNVSLALLPGGTGNDFGKTWGISWDEPEAAVAGIARGQRRTIDVGRVEDRYFLNVVGLGFDIAVIDDAESVPLLRGDAVYQFSAMRQLFRFPGIEFELIGGEADAHAGGATSRRVERRKYLMLTISNAQYFGGSFHIAPKASLEDGKLDAVAIHDGGPLTRAKLFQRVGKGNHRHGESVTMLQDARFEVVLNEAVRYEVDGEVLASKSSILTVESVPGALDLIVPAS